MPTADPPGKLGEHRPPPDTPTASGEEESAPPAPLPMRPVSTDDAPRPRGHYSQALVHKDTVYVSGQLAIDPAQPGAPPPADIGAQTRQALANVDAILQAADSGLDQALQVTLFISDEEGWTAVNEAYAEALGTHRPARAVIPVGRLPRGFLVEIQAVAALRGEGTR